MKTVIITGTSHGLGTCLSNAFLNAGWRVVGTGRSPKPDNLNESVDYHQFDASDTTDCADFWDKLDLKDSDEVCLVNNAGGFVAGGLLGTKLEDYEKQMKSNYFSGVYMTRGLAGKVDKARIINVISNSALAPNANTPAYGSAKAASKYFFQSLQQEFPPDKYKITNLFPSDIATAEPNPNSIDPNELTLFVLELAQSQASYYARDITLFPSHKN